MRYTRVLAAALVLSFLVLLVVPPASAGDGAVHSVVLRYHFDATNPAVLASTTQSQNVLNATAFWSPAGAKTYANQTGDLRLRYYLAPTVAANLTLGPQVDVHPWMVGQTGGGGEMQGNFELTLFEVRNDGSGGLAQTQIGSATQVTGAKIPLGTVTNLYQAQDVDAYNGGGKLRFQLGGAGFGHTIPAGRTLLVDLLFHPTGQQPKYNLWYDAAAAPTHIVVQTRDTPTPASLTVENEDTGTSLFAADHGNATFRAGIRAPLGRYDIASATITVTGPGGAPVVPTTPLAAAGSGVAGIFPYTYTWTYNAATPGTYSARVDVADTKGNTGTRSLTFQVGIDLRYVNLTLHDAHGVPLAGTPWRLYSGDVELYSGSTTAAGVVALRLTNSTYRIEADWEGVRVLNASVTVAGDVASIRVAAVHYPVLRVVDDAGRPVPGAALFVTYPNGTTPLSPVYTNASGDAALGRHADGLYAATAWYRGIPVNATSFTIGGDGPFVVNARMHTLTVALRILGTGEPLAGSKIEAVDLRGFVAGSAETNATGVARLLLPADIYDVAATWRGVEVNRTRTALNTSGTLDLAARIFRAEFRLVDRDGRPVEGARMEAIGPLGVVASASTTRDGSATLLVPADTYRITARWLGVLVANRTLDVDGAGPFSIAAAGGNATVSVVDGAGRPLAHASVSLEAGAARISGQTDEAGRLAVRLPDGVYSARVTWMGVEVGSATIPIGATPPAPLVTRAFDLVVRAVFDDGDVVAGAAIEVRDGFRTVVAAGHTGADGTATFRLPAAAYAIHYRHQWTHLWRAVDASEDRPVNLAADASTTFTEEKPSVVTAPLTLAVTGGLVALAAIVALASRLRRGP